MKIVKPSKQYEIGTVQGQTLTVTFFHKEGQLTFDGVTSEALLDVLINRHKSFMEQVDTVENINIFTHLSQAKSWMTTRNINKQERKKNKKP